MKKIAAAILAFALIAGTPPVGPESVSAAENSQENTRSESIKLQDASEGTYGTEQRKVTQLEQLTTVSTDEKIAVKIWTDNEKHYYYSVSRDGKTVIECSALGIITADADLSLGMDLDASTITKKSGVEDYDILQGSSSHVHKEYNETSFTLKKGNSKVTVFFRVFEDGMAYRYEVDADTASSTEVTKVTREASEFMLPDNGTIWTNYINVTYEGNEYTKRTMRSQYDANDHYSTPILASLGEESGNAWLLLSEANVYNEKDPYCASIFKTDSGSKAMKMTFGQYLVEETDESKDQQTGYGTYRFIPEVTMTDVFHTPWRVAIIASDPAGIATSSLITDLNPDPAPGSDYSWVEPGASVWSWWSSSVDAINYKTMNDYIDFAAEAGFKYCLVDYSWELWDNYREEIKKLVEYADQKGVSLLLWYGVNKSDGAHIFDLDSADEIEKEFKWCAEIGVKGVKVDYLNSDSQFAMKVMYDLADIAAKYHLVLNYHGCTNPNGENRTFPNILSSEAIAGMENFKFSWSRGPSVATMLTFPFTRNVLGSMEFTPTCYRVTTSDATSGFMLAHAVNYESAIQTFAHSAYVYPGYNGLSLLSDVPTTWDETHMIEAYPGESMICARRNGENWYLGAMTLHAKTYKVPLDFLEKGAVYHAYIYKDNAAGEDIEIEMIDVTSETVLEFPLLANGGCSVKFSKTDALKTTSYDKFNYYEAEDRRYATVNGDARIDAKRFTSGLKYAGYVGNNATSTLTFKIPAPSDGTYILKVYFVTGEDRDLYLKVNEGSEIVCRNLNANDWEAVYVTEDIPVQLKEGENTIILYNNNGYAPDIDRIAVSNPNASDAPIFPEKPSLENASVTLDAASYPYAGKAVKPKVTVTMDGQTLASEHYKLEYSNNNRIGTASVTITGIGSYTGSQTKTFAIKAQNGAAFTSGAYKYKITSASTVSFTGLKSAKTTKVSIPKTVKYGGKSFKVTTIAAKALQKKTKVTSITIGTNVTSIGTSAFEGCSRLTKATIGTGVAKINANAFKNCKKLGSVAIKSSKLKSVGKNAFKGTKATAKIKVPSKKLKSYKNLLKGKGLGKKAKITK